MDHGSAEGLPALEQLTDHPVQDALEKAIACAREPEVRAKMGATRRGKPMPRSAVRKSAAARKCKPLSVDHRRKIGEALRNSTSAAWVATAWTPEEDALIAEFPVEEVAERTGRSLHAVRSRKPRLLSSVQR